MLFVFVMGKQESMTWSVGAVGRCGRESKPRCWPCRPHDPPLPGNIKQRRGCCVFVTMKRDTCHPSFINQGAGGDIKLCL